MQFNNIVNGTYTLHVLSTVSGGPSDSRTVAFTGFGSPGDPGPYVRPLRSENAFVSVDAEPETSIPMDENGNVKVQGTYDVNTVTGLKISFLRENTEPKEGRITLFEGGDWKGRFTEMTARDGYTLQVIPDDAGTEPLSVAPLGIAEPE
ncbi:MAG: hypothetical protein HY040_15030 [Planctomycetes bacterium]|nr:hypothetical protein [Planctomycetota bacterium]